MLEITVYGIPAAQGSKKHVGHGVMIESSKKVKPWRTDVAHAAIEAMGGAGRGIKGPVILDIVFTMPKPKSAPKKRATWPDRKPDLDKLCRSTFDALVNAGAIEDDARVVTLNARKAFPMEYPGALEVPGARIRIEGIA